MLEKSDNKKLHLLNRREILFLLGGASMASMVGCTNARSNSKELEKIVGCVVSPEQTEGPYFVNDKLNRKDIRSDPKSKKISQGVLLNLELTVFQVSKKLCKPLPNAMVDIWHCDANGIYSDVEDFNADTRGKKYLRGYQMTDKKGKVEFTTIYPGWYSGRTVHIHYKVRTNPNSNRGHELTSQLYFDDSITEEIHKQKPYSERGKPTVSNKRDGIYRDGGDKLMLDLSKKGNGFLGKFNIGLQMS